jgi:Bacterial PH domain
MQTALFSDIFVGDESKGDESAKFVGPLLIEGEAIIFATKGMRDGAVFTERRIIVTNKQGITGKKVEVSSIWLKSITAFSVENSGTIDLDAEVKIWGSGWGRAEFKFTKGFDVKKVAHYLANAPSGL